MDYNIDDMHAPSPPAQREMDELDLSKAKKKMDTSGSAISKMTVEERKKALDDLPPLKIDSAYQKKEEPVYVPEMTYAQHKSKHYKSPEEKKEIIKKICGFFGVVLVIYAAIFAYTKYINGVFIKETSEKLVTLPSSLSLTGNFDTTVSESDKTANGLSLNLADTDSDGLSDAYELSTRCSDPTKKDTDGDGIYDGLEIATGLDPNNANSDGTRDKERVFELDYIYDNIDCNTNFHISGVAKIHDIQISPYKSNMANYPGVVSTPYEIYNSADAREFTLTFSGIKNVSTENIAIYRMDFGSDEYEEVDGAEISGTTASVNVKKDGIYFLGDKSLIGEDHIVNVFFLIDNSGSMYPAEMCDGSEENDVDFKRIDLVNNIIDELGGGVNFGAAKFTLNYTLLSPVTDREERVKNAIETIETTTENFNGTEIGGSLNKATEEFDDNPLNRNYIILITDGMSTNPGTRSEVLAIENCLENNITVFTIGLGKQITPTYLVEIAEKTNGMYFAASNAEGLDIIYEKINTLITESRISALDDDGSGMYVLADTGYEHKEDCIDFNIPTTSNLYGSPIGSAQVNKLYYSGTLPFTAEGYTSDSGKVNGYDITEHEFFTDTRQNLVDLKLDCVKQYENYRNLENKWSFTKIRDDTLLYTADTRDFVTSNKWTIETAEYTGKEFERDGFTEFIQAITFQKISQFRYYEIAAIDAQSLSSYDKPIIEMLMYYDARHQSENGEIYSFGANGDKAFELLTTELSNGKPSVVTTGDTVYNATRLLRKTNNPNSYVLEAYDVSGNGDIVKIHIDKIVLRDDMAQTTTQYSVKIGSDDVPLYIID